MKKLAIVALIVGLFYLPTLLIIQSGNKTIGSYSTEKVWEDVAEYRKGITWEEFFGTPLLEDYNYTRTSTARYTNMIKPNTLSRPIEPGEKFYATWEISYSNYFRDWRNEQSVSFRFYNTSSVFYTENTGNYTWNSNDGISDLWDLEWQRFSEIFSFGEQILGAGLWNFNTLGTLSYNNFIIYNLTFMYGAGAEPSIEVFERDLQIYNERKGTASYGGYEHKTDNLTDIDGWDLGDAKVESLFKFIAQPFTVINKARVQGAEYIGDWTYDTVVKPLIDLGDTLSKNIENYINGLWLDIWGLGEDIKDALYKIWDDATFWN